MPTLALNGCSSSLSSVVPSIRSHRKAVRTAEGGRIRPEPYSRVQSCGEAWNSSRRTPHEAYLALAVLTKNEALTV
jgi:hypothetical protein